MYGPTTNTAANRVKARTMDPAICFEVSCSSSSTDWLAEMVKARTPIDRAWPSASTPLIPGFASSGKRLAID